MIHAFFLSPPPPPPPPPLSFSFFFLNHLCVLILFRNSISLTDGWLGLNEMNYLFYLSELDISLLSFFSVSPPPPHFFFPLLFLNKHKIVLNLNNWRTVHDRFVSCQLNSQCCHLCLIFCDTVSSESSITCSTDYATRTDLHTAPS